MDTTSLAQARIFQPHIPTMSPKKGSPTRSAGMSQGRDSANDASVVAWIMGAGRVHMNRASWSPFTWIRSDLRPADKEPSHEPSPGRPECGASARSNTAAPAMPPAFGGQPLTRTIKTCRHRSAPASMDKLGPQPSQKSVPGNRPADSGGSPSRLHRSTNMAVTDDVVQLRVT